MKQSKPPLGLLFGLLTSSFLPMAWSLLPNHRNLPRTVPTKSPHSSKKFWHVGSTIRPTTTTRLRDGIDLTPSSSSNSKTKTNSNAAIYSFALLASVASWMTVALVGLSHHPVAAVQAVCTTRHNILTIGQAFAFPIPILVAVCTALMKRNNNNDSVLARRLNLGLAVASFWTTVTLYWGPVFACGYDLFSSKPWYIRYACPGLQALVGCIALVQWARAVSNNSNMDNKNFVSRIVRGSLGSLYHLVAPLQHNNKNDKHSKDADDPDHHASDTVLYAFGSLGLFVLALLPQLVSFPTATIPTILGKRMSRSASGFTWLGGVIAYCLMKQPHEQNDNSSAYTFLRRGLGLGALSHVLLVIAKAVGVDGGGLLLSGRGLWENYPSMVNAARGATVLMMATYSVLAMVALRPTKTPDLNSSSASVGVFE